MPVDRYSHQPDKLLAELQAFEKKSQGV